MLNKTIANDILMIPIIESNSGITAVPIMATS